MISTHLTPIFSGIWAEIASALVIIAIGVWAETSGVNKRSVGTNLLGLFLILVTAGLDLAVLPLLVLYLIFGISVYREKWKRLYFLFSSKTYGCLMLGIALLHTQTVQNYLELRISPYLTNSGSLLSLFFTSTLVVVACWFTSVPFAYFFGYIFKRKRKKHL